MCLIKPQFEEGRENVGKKGVVRDPKIHEMVVEDIRSFCLQNGYSVINLDFSPVKGPEGNIEYLIHIRKSDEPELLTDVDVKELISLSHSTLAK